MSRLKRFLSADLRTQILYIRDIILHKGNLKNGYIEESLEKIKSRGDFPLGAVSKVILREDAQWDSFRPQGELQRRGDQDKMACVTFSAMNCLETMINYFIKTRTQPEIVNVFKAFGLIKDGEANFSDRYIAKMSGTSIRGNSMQVVANTIRHYGLVPEDKWPYVNNWNEYYKTVLADIIKLGQQFAEYINISYEWTDPSQFNTAKKFAPIQTAVCADSSWFGEGIILRNEGQLNHAVDNDGFVTSQYDKIFDSYDPFGKKVAWNFNLGRGLLFTIALKKKFSNQPMIDQLIARGFQFIQNVQGLGEVYSLTSTGLRKVEPSELNDDYVKMLANGKKLIGVSAEMFAKLTG